MEKCLGVVEGDVCAATPHGQLDEKSRALSPTKQHGVYGNIHVSYLTEVVEKQKGGQ